MDVLTQFDAVRAHANQIALSSQPFEGKLPVDHYVAAVAALTRAGSARHDAGLFFVTSCNFTQPELEARFGPAGTSCYLRRVCA